MLKIRLITLSLYMIKNGTIFWLTYMIQPSLVVPGPVSNDGVDESGDHDAVDDVGNEVTPLSQ